MMLKKALIAAGLRRSRSDFVERSTRGAGSYRVAGYRGARVISRPPISEYIISDFGGYKGISGSTPSFPNWRRQRRDFACSRNFIFLKLGQRSRRALAQGRG